MKILRRIISSICIIAIMFSAVTPAFAEDYNSKTGSYWDKFLANVIKNSNLLNAGFVTTLSNGAAAHLSRNVCEFSSDGYHHCSSVDSVDTDSDGYILNCTCDDCHQKFYIRSSELPAAYQEHVEEMPVNGVTSTGSFVWYPTAKDIDFSTNSSVDSLPSEYVYSNYNTPTSVMYLSDNGFGIGVDCYPYGKLTNIGTNYIKPFHFGLVAPVSGTYARQASVSCDGGAYNMAGHYISISANYSERSYSFYRQGSTISRAESMLIEYLNYSPSEESDWTVYHVVEHFPVFSVIPDVSALVGHERDYDPDTRPGDIIQIDNVTIVDETNNYFTDPVTKEPQPIENWTYDYSDRSYHVTTNEGDNYTVTYGDENVTIKHGDTVNEYNYYITNNTQPDPTPVDPDHKHTYTSETVKAATCTEPGSIKYTCSGCGHTYTESVPALGHDWIISESTEDEYSFPKGVTCPNGAGHALTYTLNKDDRTYHVTCSDCGKEFDVDADVKFGHKVYTCSRCGETYEESNKDSGGLFEALGDFLADGVRWIVDKLKQLVEAFQGIGEIFTGFAQRLEESAGGYPEFFAQIVAIMPDDLMTVIWFAIVAAFAVAAWRKWFG